MSTSEPVAALSKDDSIVELTSAQNNGHVDDTTPSPKKAKVDGAGDVPVKRRSSSAKRKPEEDMMAEAKAMLGEIDTSAGRSLRKRPEKPVTPKTEEKKKPVSRKNSKKEKGESSDVIADGPPPAAKDENKVSDQAPLSTDGKDLITDADDQKADNKNEKPDDSKEEKAGNDDKKADDQQADDKQSKLENKSDVDTKAGSSSNENTADVDKTNDAIPQVAEPPTLNGGAAVEQV